MKIIYKPESEAGDIIKNYDREDPACRYVRDEGQGGPNGVGVYDLQFTGTEKCFSRNFLHCVGVAAMGTPQETGDEEKASCLAHFNMHELLEREEQGGVDPRGAYPYFEESLLSSVRTVVQNTSEQTRVVVLACKDQTYQDLSLDIDPLLQKLKKEIPEVYLALLINPGWHFHHVYTDIKNRIMMIASHKEAIALKLKKV